MSYLWQTFLSLAFILEKSFFLRCGFKRLYSQTQGFFFFSMVSRQLASLPSNTYKLFLKFLEEPVDKFAEAEIAILEKLCKTKEGQKEVNKCLSFPKKRDSRNVRQIKLC